MPRRQDDIDEEYIVADMSGVGEGLPLHGFGRRREQGTRDVRDELGGREELLAVVLGTLRAALSIGAVYVVSFGLFIAFLLAVWNHL